MGMFQWIREGGVLLATDGALGVPVHDLIGGRVRARGEHHHLLVAAKSEWQAFNRSVTDWERRRYFELI